MNILKIGARNLELKVSGKRYNKEINVVLKLEENGIGYTVNLFTSHSLSYSSVSKTAKQEVMFDVVYDEEKQENCLSFGSFLLEVMTEFSQIVYGERVDIDVNNLVTVLLKQSNFIYNSDVNDELINETEIRWPEYEGKEGETYIEKYHKNKSEYVFRYTPCGMGMKGTISGNQLIMEFEVV